MRYVRRVSAAAVLRSSKDFSSLLFFFLHIIKSLFIYFFNQKTAKHVPKRNREIGEQTYTFPCAFIRHAGRDRCMYFKAVAQRRTPQFFQRFSLARHDTVHFELNHFN